MPKIYGNTVGVGGGALGKTIILEDESTGIEIVGVITDSEKVFTATDNDVREGSVYASNAGVSTGTKVIPSYHTITGKRKITKGKPFEIPIRNVLNLYDFTELQVLICEYNNNFEESVAAVKVVIDEKVYATNSTEVIAAVTKDDDNQKIKLEFINESENSYLLRYFLYKEIY